MTFGVWAGLNGISNRENTEAPRDLHRIRVRPGQQSPAGGGIVVALADEHICQF